MAIHPKVSLVGVALGATVGFGLALFMLGRMTVAESLGGMLVGVGVGIVVVTAVGIGLVKHFAGHEMAGMILPHAQSSDEGYVSALARADLVGKSGTTVSELRPAGTAVISGERVDVITEGDWLPSNTPVTVVKAEAMRLIVRRVPALNASREHS